MHFLFGWFEFSVPLPNREGSDRPLTPDERLVGVARLIGDVIPVPIVDVVDVIEVVAPLASFDGFDPKLSRSAKPASQAVDRILLCDSARCERSGVLLI